MTVDPRVSGYERTVIHDVPVPGDGELVVRVGRGAHVEGRVLDALGLPVGDQEVRLEQEPSPEVLARPAALGTTDAEGRSSSRA